ncbi:MAG: phosphoribosylformylglycinamidine cyclo-ligase [Firmicutes bacterium]|nr:phosphoribosylformylglycinamidine cyclo-ligase [Bacillota bacterium]
MRRKGQGQEGKGESLSYKAAGVDIEAGYEVVRRIKGLARSTFRPEVVGDIGGFGGGFALKVSGSGAMRNPVLVSGTDGVGTKLKIAFMMNKHDTVGVDVVAYCVNDIICHGAEPLFFLDYFACGKLDPAQAEDVVKGVADGCRQAGCALIGGETAEMPGFYPEGEYDLAGFAVGVVERNELIDGSKVAPGDAIIGIASSGLQSSGFSLTRKVLFDVAGYSVFDEVPELGTIDGRAKTLGEELLTPTLVYARPVLQLRRDFELRGIANISGGGLPENLPRAMAEGTRARIEWGTWPVHPIFDLIQRTGNISGDEMIRTYNLGIGIAVIVDSESADGVVEALARMGHAAYIIGRVEEGPKGVEIVNLD